MQWWEARAKNFGYRIGATYGEPFLYRHGPMGTDDLIGMLKNKAVPVIPETACHVEMCLGYQVKVTRLTPMSISGRYTIVVSVSSTQTTVPSPPAIRRSLY